MNYVGIVRTNRRLKRAQKRLALVQEEIQDYYWDFRLTGSCNLRNRSLRSTVVLSTLRRRESRGLHYTGSSANRSTICTRYYFAKTLALGHSRISAKTCSFHCPLREDVLICMSLVRVPAYPQEIKVSVECLRYCHWTIEAIRRLIIAHACSHCFVHTMARPNRCFGEAQWIDW